MRMRIGFCVVLTWLVGCGGAARTADVRSAGDAPSSGPVTEAQIFAAAEALVGEALVGCPRASMTTAATMLEGGAPAICSDPRRAQASLERATELLTLVTTCRNDGGGAECLASAGALERGPARPDDACTPAREVETRAWREVAVALVMMAMLDCQLGGTPGTVACDAPGVPILLSASMGALEIASGAGPASELVDAMSTLLTAAGQAGSVGVQVPVVGAAVGQAIADSSTTYACVSLPRWRAGEGLATVEVLGTSFTLSAPVGSASTDAGLVTLPFMQPVRVGYSLEPLEGLVRGVPPECHALPLATESQRAFDCVGAALYSGDREIWVVTDLGAVRGVVVQRVRHNASDATRDAVAFLATTLTVGDTAAGDTAPFDWSAFGVAGPIRELPIVHLTEDGALQLSDRIAPGRGSPTATFRRHADAQLCTTARAVERTPPRELLDDSERADGGCDVTEFWGGSGTLLHTVRLVRRDGRFTAAELVAPAADAAAARAMLATSRAQLDQALP